MDCTPEELAEVQRVAAPLEAGKSLGPSVEWPWQKDAQGRRCDYVSADATGVRQQGPDGARVDGKIRGVINTVVGNRLKGGGMRWGEAGSDAICHLRALYLSESACWDSFWNPPPN